MLKIISLLRKVPAAGWAISLGLVILTGAYMRIVSLQSEVRNVTFAKDSVEAVASSTRKMLGDSIDFYQRRVVQTTLRADSLDAAWKQESRARISLTAQLVKAKGSALGAIHDTVVVSAPGDSVKAEAVTFDEYEAPFSLRTIFTLVPTDSGRFATLDWSLAVDPIPIGVRLGCGTQVGPGGIRQALVEFSAPKWLDISVDAAQQSRDVCSPATSLFNNSAMGRWFGVRKRDVILGSSGLAIGLYTGLRIAKSLIKGK